MKILELRDLAIKRLDELLSLYRDIDLPYNEVEINLLVVEEDLR